MGRYKGFEEIETITGRELLIYKWMSLESLSLYSARLMVSFNCLSLLFNGIMPS